MRLLLCLFLLSFLVSSECSILKQKKYVKAMHKKCPKWGETRIRKDPSQRGLYEWFRRGAVPDWKGLYPRSGDKAVRREYRTLTEAERRKFHFCLLMMKHTLAANGTSSLTEYDTFVIHHTFDQAPEAHESPAFLVFHRVYLYTFERLMRSHDGCHDVGLPYWDPTLDGFMPNPSHTVMFNHPDFLGNGNGEVTSGIFVNWTSVLPEYCLKIGTRLTRDLCTEPDQLLTDEILEKFVTCGRFEDCVIPKNRDFEDFHGLIHGCLGGHMLDLTCAPNDPAFFLYHCFIDYIFQEYLDRNYPIGKERGSNSPEKDYPQTVDKPYHLGTARLLPFTEYSILDGLSRNFSHMYVRYEPRPHECTSDADCGGKRSRLLWCDTAPGRCKAKIHIGGDCSGQPDNACFSDCPDNQMAICSTKSVTCQCEWRSCHSDSDCVDQELDGYSGNALCDLKTSRCQKKYNIGENCGSLPDKYCSGKCANDYESPRCVSGTCVCEVKPIKCGSANDCPASLWCDADRCKTKIAFGGACRPGRDEMCGAYSGSKPGCPRDTLPLCGGAGLCSCSAINNVSVRKFNMSTITTSRPVTVKTAPKGGDSHKGNNQPQLPLPDSPAQVISRFATAPGLPLKSCFSELDCPSKEYLCVKQKTPFQSNSFLKFCFKIACTDDISCRAKGLQRIWCNGGFCARQLPLGQSCRGMRDGSCINVCLPPLVAACYEGVCQCVDVEDDFVN